MTKPWNVKDIVADLKKHGLPMLEKDVIVVVGILLDWVEESIRLSDTKFDDMALMAMPLLRQYAEKMASKISPDALKTVDQGLNQASVDPIPKLPNA